MLILGGGSWHVGTGFLNLKGWKMLYIIVEVFLQFNKNTYSLAAYGGGFIALLLISISRWVTFCD